MVATPYNKKANPVFLINQTDGQPYVIGEGIADSVTVTGDALTAMQATATEIGPVNAAAVTNPASSGSVIALLKGILTELQTANGLLNDIKTNTTP